MTAFVLWSVPYKFLILAGRDVMSPSSSFFRDHRDTGLLWDRHRPASPDRPLVPCRCEYRLGDPKGGNVHRVSGAELLLQVIAHTVTTPIPGLPAKIWIFFRKSYEI